MISSFQPQRCQMLSHRCGTTNHCPDVSQPVHFIIIIPRDRYIIRLYFNPLQHASSVNPSKRTCVYNTQLIRTLFNFQEPHTSCTYLQSIYVVQHTVDGRNLANQLRLVLFTRFYTSQVVVWDLFHQQYH